jgi:hypothetical protein
MLALSWLRARFFRSRCYLRPIRPCKVKGGSYEVGAVGIYDVPNVPHPGSLQRVEGSCRIGGYGPQEVWQWSVYF